MSIHLSEDDRTRLQRLAKVPNRPGPVGRAVAGFAAGGIVGLGILIILARGGGPVDPAQGLRILLAAVGAGAVAGAILGGCFGAREIPSGVTMVLRRMGLGALFGVAAGIAIGNLSEAPKVGVLAGLFLGGPIGAVVGGLIGAMSPVIPVKQAALSWDDGLRDRELDG